MGGYFECETPGCNGDGRYAAPGKGHLPGCRYPFETDPKPPELIEFSDEQIDRLGHWLSECLDDAAPLREHIWRSRAEWMVKGPTFQGVLRSMHKKVWNEGHASSLGYDLSDEHDSAEWESLTKEVANPYE